MVARDQHRIVVISPFELRLKPRVVLDHEQSTLFGPRPTHRQPAFPISNAPIPCAPASACGKRSAKLLPFPGSLVTSIVPPIACASCSASKAPRPKPAALVEIGRAAGRDRGCPDVEISGVASSLKKKTKK